LGSPPACSRWWNVLFSPENGLPHSHTN
jgi:hypothetical protein